MKIKTLIIGYGSIGRRHSEVLSKIVGKSNIYILSKQKNIPFKSIEDLSEIEKLNPDYIVISSATSLHLEQLKYLEDCLSNKKILVEKPIFSETSQFIPKNNEVFVGYNYRFHPVIEFLKEKTSSKIIWNVNVFCGSDLRSWRNNIDYKNSSSARKSSGGGVLLDLSHEIDYLQWIFRDMKISFSRNKKISDLEIETDDFLSINGYLGKNINLQLTLNYFSKLQTRKIIVDGEDISLICDLINNNVEIWDKGKVHIKRFESFERNHSFKMLHTNILKGYTKNVCDFKQSIEVMNIIEEIRSSSL